MSGLRICPKNAKAHYNVAKIANNSETSISHYKKALDLWPSYEHAMNNLGNIYKDQGKFKEAEKLFKKALVISPKFAACWMNLGIVQVNLNKFKEAEKSYVKALDLKFGIYPDCLFNLGTLYLKMRKLETAVFGNILLLFCFGRKTAYKVQNLNFLSTVFSTALVDLNLSFDF